MFRAEGFWEAIVRVQRIFSRGWAVFVYGGSFLCDDGYVFLFIVASKFDYMAVSIITNCKVSALCN